MKRAKEWKWNPQASYEYVSEKSQALALAAVDLAARRGTPPKDIHALNIQLLNEHIAHMDCPKTMDRALRTKQNLANQIGSATRSAPGKAPAAALEEV